MPDFQRAALASAAARAPVSFSAVKAFTTGSDIAVTTAADGSYKFVDVAPGEYHIREVPQADFAETQPASGVYNAHLVRPGLALVKGWQRMQGVVHRPDDARFAGRSAAEAVSRLVGRPLNRP